MARGGINIGITGTGSLIGQAIIKSIKKSSYATSANLIGFDYFEKTVGSFWCSKNYILPDILKHKDLCGEWLSRIIETCQQNKLQLLFVGVDFELPLFAKYKSQIEAESNVKVIVSSEEVVNIANDKYLTCLFLSKNNLPHPNFWLPETLDTDNLSFPVIVKPRVGARSIGVVKIHNVEELVAAIKITKNPIIQEYIGNDDREFTCGTIFLDNEVQQSIALLRTLKGGNTFTSTFKKDFPENIEIYLKQTANALKPFGACNFQLRLDDSGSPKIFEINARHSGTTYIRSLFGYNEVEFIISFLLRRNKQIFRLKEGTVIRYFEEFLVPLESSEINARISYGS